MTRTARAGRGVLSGRNPLMNQPLAPSLLVVLATISAGVAISLSPLPVQIALAATVGVVAVGVVYLTAQPRVDSRSQNAYQMTRGAFYLGLLMSGFLTIRPVGNLAMGDLVMALSLPVLLLEAATSRARLHGYAPRGVAFGALLLVMGGLSSSASSTQPIESIAVVARVIAVTLIWFWLGSVVLRTKNHVRRGVTAWTITAGLAGAFAVLQLALGDFLPGAVSIWGRMTGSTGHPNDLGALCAIALAPSVALMWNNRSSRGWRAVWAVVLAFIVAGLLLSGSVAAFLATFGGISAWFLMSRSQGRLWIIAGGIGLLATAFMITQSAAGQESALGRLGEVFSTPDNPYSTVWSRVFTYQAAWEAISNNPLIGVGFAVGGSATPTGYAVHNALLAAWYQGGMLGMLGLATIGLSLFTIARRIVLSAQSDDAMLTTAVVAALVSAAIISLSSPILYQRYFWLPALFIVVIAAIARDEPSARNSAARQVAQMRRSTSAGARTTHPESVA